MLPAATFSWSFSIVESIERYRSGKQHLRLTGTSARCTHEYTVIVRQRQMRCVIVGWMDVRITAELE